MTDSDLVFSRERFGAVIFDLDGVVTHTAGVHAAAWKRLLDAFFEDRPARQGENLSAFDSDRDYRRYIDGRPRYQGVQHFLAARHIHLPIGTPDDPPERITVCGLGNRKNRIFRELIEKQGLAVDDCAIALLRRLRRAGIKTAAVSASRNCSLILERAGIPDLFDALVDGLEAERLQLDGKPEPDTFLEAARRLGVDPKQSSVLEDVIAGVTAGRRGRFGLVIGVDRDGQRRALSEHGADLVLEDLCGIVVEESGEPEVPIPRQLLDMTLVSNRLAEKRPALFLDYDGTLTPIVERPQDARISEDMRQTLRDVARTMPLAVISGRDLADVRQLVGVPDIIYAGSHGFAIEGPDLRLELAEGVDALDDLDDAEAELIELLRPVPKARLERKRFAIAVHYRQVADEDLARVDSAVALVQKSHAKLCRRNGKKIFELRPDIEWDKGRAIRWLLTELGLNTPDVLPIYVGDDLTDEDAFRALQGLGLGILVADAPQPSAAAFRLTGPDQVATLLQHLILVERRDD